MDIERFKHNFIFTLFTEQVVVDSAPLVNPIDSILKTCRISHPRGATRAGRGKNGNWKTKMSCDYGKVIRDEGGEFLNAFIGPNKKCSHVYIVRQVEPISGDYDEDKAMIGFNDAREAVNTYLSHYEDPNRFGWVTVVTPEQFLTALADRGDLLNFKSDNISEYIPTEDVCTTGGIAMGGMNSLVPQQSIVVGKKKPKRKRVAMPKRNNRVITQMKNSV